jgi:hypothetical protein
MNLLCIIAEFIETIINTILGVFSLDGIDISSDFCDED